MNSQPAAANARTFQGQFLMQKLMLRVWRLVPAIGLGIAMSWASSSLAQTRPPRPVPSRPAPVRPVPPRPTPAQPAPTPPVQAAPTPTVPAEPAPPELTRALNQIDAAANRRDVNGVMSFYSSTLVHSDGLTFRTMQQALANFWERFSNVRYQTTINSWQREGNALIAETTTTITGTQRLGDRTMTLNATIGSRQRFEGGKIVRQDILTERSQLTAGERPPTVQVLLPQQIGIGREFNFDAIVQEPLGDRLLLGTAIEEPVQASGYTTSAPVNFELLSAGGLFKVGRAPALPDSRWISAVLIRNDGITAITQRLRVVSRDTTAEQPSTRPAPTRPPAQNPTRPAPRPRQ